MIYSEYFKNLTPIEIRLFKEGYWKFHPPSAMDDAIIFRTYKWNALIAYLHSKNKTIVKIDNKYGDVYQVNFDMFTEYEILKCLNNPELFKDKVTYSTILSYTKKDGSVSVYKRELKRKI